MTDLQLEKASDEYADNIKISTSIPGALVPLLYDIAKDSYRQGAQDALGLQEAGAAETEISGWVARDKNGALFIYKDKPSKISPQTIWHGELAIEAELDTLLFPDLTWESDPIEVELIIKRKKNAI